MENKISLFKNTFSQSPDSNLEIDSYLDGILEGRWKEVVLSYRSAPTKKAKNLIPAVTPSGRFDKRESSKIINHSGFICLDIDIKDQICDIDISAIKSDEYTYAVHKSLGGFGYAVYIKIDQNRHLDAFLGLEHYYFSKYSIVLDNACKDTSRLRYVSYDPDLFKNKKARVFKQYLKKVDVIKYDRSPIVVLSDFDEMVDKASTMNLFEDYNDYIRLAFALSSEFGEGGRKQFHALCSSSLKYNSKSADKDFDTALKRNKNGVTIGFVYYHFKNAGISLRSEKTENILSIAKLSENPKEKLKELGIEDNEGILDLVKPNANEQKTTIDEIIDLIKIYQIKFNEITRNYEWNGKPMDDRMLAKFYTQVWKRIDSDISKDKIFTLLENRDNTPSYNPIHSWFEQNKNIITNNEFEKLKDCFEINHKILDGDEASSLTTYLDVYLKKWLLGLIGSAYGTYSLMILVLNGEQGTFKTVFFRTLFPESLRWLYAENNLDDGKDSEILMTRKWLIVDDEFGGKSKKDAKKLKRLSSQQVFSIRKPYGRLPEDLNRLAVFGGTSNENEIINDPTGNRRIIPINVISFDLVKYKQIDKDKLFIGLYKEWKGNPEGWFLTKSEIEILNKSTVMNSEVMAEVELINECFQKTDIQATTNTEIKIILECLSPQIKTNTKRIGQALRICGFKQEVVDNARKYNCIIRDQYRERVHNFIKKA